LVDASAAWKAALRVAPTVVQLAVKRVDPKAALTADPKDSLAFSSAECLAASTVAPTVAPMAGR